MLRGRHLVVPLDPIFHEGDPLALHGVRDRPVDAAFIEQMKARGAWYIPTLSLDEATFVYADDPPWTQTPFFKEALSPALRAQLQSSEWRAKTKVAPDKPGLAPGD